MAKPISTLETREGFTYTLLGNGHTFISLDDMIASWAEFVVMNPDHEKADKGRHLLELLIEFRDYHKDVSDGQEKDGNH